MVNLTIDGKQISTAKTATIYEAARDNNIHIPVLCHTEKLNPYGACRICVVEVEQMKGRLIPSCSTPVSEGMVVTTMTDEIRKVRKTILEFILVNHVLDCPVCDKGGECDLQDLAYDYGVTGNRFEGEKFDLPLDDRNPLIARNLNRCILCGKCVRVCDEVVGFGAYSFINRGFETQIATAFDRDLNCEFCGQCISLCPVGALLPRPFQFKARPWQLNEVDSVCGYCGNGCTVTLGVKDNAVQTIRYNDKIGANEGNLCVRGRFGYSYVNSDQRLQQPLVRRDGELVETSWDEALELLTSKLKAAGDKAGIISGARLTNEELLLVKQLAAAVGTDNLDHSGGESYKGLSEGLFETLGVKASTATFPQIKKCDAILAIRSDFYETHPVCGMVVNQAIRNNDAQLTVIADKKGKLSGLPRARTLEHKPGLELNLLNALCHVLIEEGLAQTEGLDGLSELQTAVAAYSPDAVAAQAGTDAEAIRTTARELASAKNAAILLAYGLPYTAHSKELGLAAANLALLLGIPGREGSGLYLCGEKSNSQGAVDLGIMPQGSGLGVNGMFKAAAAGKLDLLYIIGEDPLVSYPDRDLVAAALVKPFVVVDELFLSRTARHADLVLPAASFAEKDGTFTNAERRIQRVRAGIKSPGAARSEFVILQQLLTQLGHEPAETPAAAFAELTEKYSDYAAIELEQIGPQGHVWGGECLAPRKRCLVAVVGSEPLDAEYQLLVGSALYHSGTLSVHSRGPMAVVDEPYIELCRKDAETLQLIDGDRLQLMSDRGAIEAKVKVDRRLPQGVMFAPYHFAELGLNRIYLGQAVIAVTPAKIDCSEC